MAADLRKARLKKLAEEGTKKYGEKSAITGFSGIPTGYYSTGSTAVDYALGTGGFPDNAFAEVFGPPSIGKTTIFGLGVMKAVHAAGGITAMIATEPDVSEEWMAMHGVDPELNIVYRPDSAEEAFAILRDLVYERGVDYFVYDSLAAGSSQKEQNSDKPQAFGNAALNSWGIKNVAVRAWKNRVGGLFINQIRDNAKSPIPGAVKSTGGHAVEHFMKIRLQLKPGKEQYKVKAPSFESGKANDDMMVGREIRVSVIKNKAAQELSNKAVLDFYHIRSDEYPFGFDYGTELVNTAKVAGVLQGTGWIQHEVFPGGKINGSTKAAEFFTSNNRAYEKVRAEVMEVAQKRSAKLEAEKKVKAKEAQSA